MAARRRTLLLEWTAAGAGARLKMLVLHYDAAREYAYGPAQGLPDTKVGAFTPALHDEAKKNGWSVSIVERTIWKVTKPALGREVANRRRS